MGWRTWQVPLLMKRFLFELLFTFRKDEVQDTEDALRVTDGIGQRVFGKGVRLQFAKFPDDLLTSDHFGKTLSPTINFYYYFLQKIYN